MTHHVFDTTRQAPFEIGASIFALLAYPKDDAADRRRRVSLALGKAYLEKCIRDEPHIGSDLRRQHAAYFATTARYSFSSLNKRLEESERMGTLVLPFIQQVATGQPIRLPAQVKRASWSEMARFLLPAEPEESEEGYEERLRAFDRRIKRDRFTVAHLAAAFALAGRIPECASAGLHIENLNAFRTLIQVAQGFGPAIQASPPLTRQGMKLATFEWIEPGAPRADFCP